MSNHISYVSLDIQGQLTHLQIPDSFDMSQSTFIAASMFCDTHKAEYHFPGRTEKSVIAIKRLRLNLKKDIIMVCIGQVHKYLFQCLIA